MTPKKVFSLISNNRELIEWVLSNQEGARAILSLLDTLQPEEESEEPATPPKTGFWGGNPPTDKESAKALLTELRKLPEEGRPERKITLLRAMIAGKRPFPAEFNFGIDDDD